MTIKEISDKISISTATIDRVIHNRGRVNPETKAYILEKLEEYNYVPNPNGQVMAGIKKRFKVAILVPDEKEEFNKVMYQGLTANYSVLKNSGTTIYDIEYKKQNEEDFMEKLSKVIADKVNCIILYAPYFHKAESILAKARQDGCFVVALNSRLKDDAQDVYCGHNNYVSGKTAMQMLCMGLRPNANIAVFAGSKEENAHVERLRGTLDYLKSAETPYNLVSIIDYCDDFESKLAKEWNGKKIDGILILSIYPTIMDSLLKCKEAKDALIGCFDLTPKNIDNLKKHKVSFILEQNPFHQSKKSIEYVQRHLFFGEKNFQDYYTDCTIITDINIDIYLKNHDYLTSDSYD